MGERRDTCRVLMATSEGKSTRRRLRRRCEHNIKMNLRKIGWEVVEWTDLAQDRDEWRALVNTTVNLQISLTARNFLSG
jgi:hypothetical protein